MDRYIGNELDKRYSEYKANRDGKRTKAVIDLVLQVYLSENNGTKSTASCDQPDPDFSAFAISQIRLFVFVGHDSTSSTICYILDLLAAHADILAQVRQEMIRFLGRAYRTYLTPPESVTSHQRSAIYHCRHQRVSSHVRSWGCKPWRATRR